MMRADQVSVRRPLWNIKPLLHRGDGENEVRRLSDPGDHALYEHTSNETRFRLSGPHGSCLPEWIRQARYPRNTVEMTERLAFRPRQLRVSSLYAMEPGSPRMRNPQDGGRLRKE
jgi:hypothetical protein